MLVIIQQHLSSAFKLSLDAAGSNRKEHLADSDLQNFIYPTGGNWLKQHKTHSMTKTTIQSLTNNHKEHKTDIWAYTYIHSNSTRYKRNVHRELNSSIDVGTNEFL